ncbi:MAG: thioredoxin domain-containing protein [Acidobacteria bacterium]|nr:thioredoxin domain-containing protein [Acidobacteriota bacterium]
MNRFAALLLSVTLALPLAAQTIPDAPSVTAADPLPKADPQYFDAASPTLETVNAFLHAIWGYDHDRIYRVMAIQKTTAPNVSKVVIFVTSRTPGAQVQTVQFFTTPDGKHAIADTVFDFGAKPFADNRVLMQQKADGPAHGAASKDLLLVEFADMQCPHCKVAQETMANVVRDFPTARVVYQNFPLTSIHPFAAKAAAYGNCVAKKSNDAFWIYLQDVFDHQEALNAEAGDATLANAVRKLGQDPAAIAACAASPEEQKHVKEQIAFANSVGVSETPMLSVNGHLLPLGSLSYEQLKQIITFQAQQDEVPLK